MSEATKIPTEVYAEMTPNPSTMKFVTNRTLIEGGQQVEYTSQKETMGSSTLAQELFNFPFVKGIFISGNFVTVMKDESLDWDLIIMQMREYMRDWLMENEIAVQNVPEELDPSSDKYSRESSSGDQSAQSAPTEKIEGPIEATEYDEEIRTMLNDYVRPAVEQDGGAIDFKAFKDGKVYVQLRGACSGCPSSLSTLKGGIEQLLKSKLDVVESVVAEEV
jgi:Fe-S cluster biogenesis protein NfuA